MQVKLSTFLLVSLAISHLINAENELCCRWWAQDRWISLIWRAKWVAYCCIDERLAFEDDFMVESSVCKLSHKFVASTLTFTEFIVLVSKLGLAGNDKLSPRMNCLLNYLLNLFYENLLNWLSRAKSCWILDFPVIPVLICGFQNSLIFCWLCARIFHQVFCSEL